jgi:hypothetical protein
MKKLPLLQAMRFRYTELKSSGDTNENKAVAEDQALLGSCLNRRKRRTRCP